MNGNNYITSDTVNETIMSEDNLATVTINGEEYSEMICTNIWTEDGMTRFIIREMTGTEKMLRLISQMSAKLNAES